MMNKWFLFFLWASLGLAEHDSAGLKSPPYPQPSCPDQATVRRLYEQLKQGRALNPAEMDFLRSAAKNIPNCPNTFSHEDVLALMRWTQTLPCDLTSFKNPVKVIFIPEDHHNPRPNIYLHYFKRLKEGKAFIAYETLLAEKAKLELSTLSAAERKRVNLRADGVLPILATSLDSFDEDDSKNASEKKYRATPEHLIEALVGSIAEPDKVSADIFEEALQRISKQDAELGRSAKGIYEHLKTRASVEQRVKFFSSGEKVEGGKILKSMLKNFPEKELAKILELLASTSASVIRDKISDTQAQFRSIPPLLPPKRNRFELCDPLVFEAWRNRNFLHSLVSMICDAGKEGVPEVILHLGALHAPEVFKLLEQTLKSEKDKNKVNMQVDVSFLSSKTFQDPDMKWFRDLFDKIPKENKFTFQP